MAGANDNGVSGSAGNAAAGGGGSSWRPPGGGGGGGAVTQDREGYALAAGFALGLVALGRGRHVAGLADLHIEERLRWVDVGGSGGWVGGLGEWVVGGGWVVGGSGGQVGGGVCFCALCWQVLHAGRV